MMLHLSEHEEHEGKKEKPKVGKWAYHHTEAQNLFPEHLHSLFLAAGMIIPPSSGSWTLFSSVSLTGSYLKKKKKYNAFTFP